MQRSFALFSIVTDGLNFGTTNYNKVLPVDLYKDFADELVVLMQEFKDKEMLRDSWLRRFMLNTLASSADVLPYMSSDFTKVSDQKKKFIKIANKHKPLKSIDDTSYTHKVKLKVIDPKTETASEVIEKHHYDLAFKYEKDKYYPAYIKTGNKRSAVAYKLMPLEANLSGATVVGYIRIGSLPNGVYASTEDRIEVTAKMFGSEVPSMFTNDSDTKIKSNQDFDKGTEVRVIAFDDITREEAKIATITGKSMVGIDGTITYNIKLSDEPVKGFNKEYLEWEDCD